MRRLTGLPRFVLQRARNAVYTLTYAVVARVRPIRPGSVIFVTNRTAELTDNLRCLDEALDHGTYSVSRWFFAPGRSLPAQWWQSLRFIVAMAQTQYVLVDDFFALVYAVKVRPGAKLVQVWHALGAMKRVGYSRSGRGQAAPFGSVTHRNYTDVIVSADSIRPDYAEAFGVAVSRVHATGAPRSDLFFDEAAQAAARARLYAEVPALAGRRVILFAPTFRGETKRTATYPPEFCDLERLGAALAEDDLLVIKMHPFVTGRPAIPAQWADRVVDLSDTREFNELLLVTDVLVTDYSSAIFEYALLGRPVIFYTPDLAAYDHGRGFYYDFSTYTYGPVATDLDRLSDLLRAPTLDLVRLAVFREQFLNRCDGHATHRVIETIFADRPLSRDPAPARR